MNDYENGLKLLGLFTLGSRCDGHVGVCKDGFCCNCCPYKTKPDKRGFVIVVHDALAVDVRTDPAFAWLVLEAFVVREDGSRIGRWPIWMREAISAADLYCAVCDLGRLR